MCIRQWVNAGNGELFLLFPVFLLSGITAIAVIIAPSIFFIMVSVSMIILLLFLHCTGKTIMM